MKLTIPSVGAINSIAEEILSGYPGARIFAFYGEMGVGKTTLIKAFCIHLGVTNGLSSPTYSIVNQYNGKETIYHIDLYRIKTINEAFGIGIEEYINSSHYCLIEWAELIDPLLPEGTIKIYMTVTGGEVRELNIQKV